MADPMISEAFAPLVAHTGRQWRRALDLQLQPFGLTEASWLPLLHLARAHAPMRQKDLAASLALDNSSVVRLLDGLQSAGLIERREEASDRRAKAILLTREGRATVERVESVSQAVRAAALADVTEQDLAVASNVLAQICTTLGRMAGEDVGDQAA